MRTPNVGGLCKKGHPLFVCKDGRRYCRTCSLPQKREYGKIYYEEHKEAVAKSVSEWKKKNPDKVKATNRKSKLKSTYGLTLEQYYEIVKKQGNLCAACGRPLPALEDNGRLPPVDHDHISGKVRGVLHRRCNLGIGQFEDSPELLRLAAEYLEAQNVPD